MNARLSVFQPQTLLETYEYLLRSLTVNNGNLRVVAMRNTSTYTINKQIDRIVSETLIETRQCIH